MKIEEIKGEFDSYLESFLSELPNRPKTLYGGVQYVLDAPAKRLRPLAVLLACYLFEDNYQKALPAALSIEIFHNFTLVHDDIMDRAEMRRGRPTVHKKFGTNEAILIGDVMMIQAYRMLLHLEEEIDLDLVIELFSETSTGICEGQILDMELEENHEAGREQYLEMIGLKTAVLLGLAFQLGAVVAGREKESDQLYQYGYSLGIAFQVMDDWIDAFGDEEKTGKKRGGDVRQKKKTWLWFTAMDLADEEDRVFLESIMEKDQLSDSDVNQTLKIYELYNVSEEVLNFTHQLLEGEKAKMKDLDIAEQKLDLLLQLSDNLVKRIK